MKAKIRLTKIRLIMTLMVLLVVFAGCKTQEPFKPAEARNISGDDFELLKSPRRPVFTFSSDALTLAFSRDGIITDVFINKEPVSRKVDGGFVVHSTTFNDSYYVTGEISEKDFKAVMRNIVLKSTYQESSSSIVVSGTIKSYFEGVHNLKLSYRLPVDMEGWEYNISSSGIEFAKGAMVLGIRDSMKAATFHYSLSSGLYIEYDMSLFPLKDTGEFKFEIYGK